MKKIITILVLILLLTGCGAEKGTRLICTKSFNEKMLNGTATITIDYNEEQKPTKYVMNSEYYVNQETYESYGESKEDNMKTIGNSIQQEIAKDYETYNPTVDSSIEDNKFSIKLTIDDKNFLKTIGK